MAQLLIIDDDPKIRLFLSDILEGWGHVSAQAGTAREGKRQVEENNFDIVLLDLDLPDENGLQILPDLIRSASNPEVIIITGTGDINGAKLAFKYGAWDYIQKPFTIDEVSLPIARALEYRREKKGPSIPFLLNRQEIIGESNAMQSCLDEVARAAVSNASVLITGETGTGKELFARAIHQNSKRASCNFVALDCGAIPETLAEECFFGHEKGAFTGADTQRDGVIKQADGGTLFLDEIGDLAPGIQKSLLRTLQEKTVRPLGGREIAVDFRLIAATNRDLVKRIADNTFREDLLFRVQGLLIHLPPLRKRDNDIHEITLKKIPQICTENGSGIKGLSPEFMNSLSAHSWPGNVRELINVLEFACASAGDDPTLHPKHLPAEYRTALLYMDNGKNLAEDYPEEEKNDGETFPKLADHRARAERRYFEQLIARAKGNREEACKLAGISQARLYGILKKYNLSLFNPFRSK